MQQRLEGLYGPRAAPRGHPLRHLTAVVLFRASHLLALLAEHLVQQARDLPPGVIEIEFHAEPGSPDGAVYVNGELIGHVPGVRRI